MSKHTLIPILAATVLAALPAFGQQHEASRWCRSPGLCVDAPEGHYFLVVSRSAGGGGALLYTQVAVVKATGVVSRKANKGNPAVQWRSALPWGKLECGVVGGTPKVLSVVRGREAPKDGGRNMTRQEQFAFVRDCLLGA